MTDAIADLRAEMRSEFTAIRAELGTIRARVDGLPFIGQAIETLRQDVRMLRAAINDMARVNITAGEVEALHAELDRVQSRQIEIETRLAALERGGL